MAKRIIENITKYFEKSQANQYETDVAIIEIAGIKVKTITEELQDAVKQNRLGRNQKIHALFAVIKSIIIIITMSKIKIGLMVVAWIIMLKTQNNSMGSSIMSVIQVENITGKVVQAIATVTEITKLKEEVRPIIEIVRLIINIINLTLKWS